MISYITQGRIVRDTEVQHPSYTQGLWLTAKQVKILRDKLYTPPAPPVQSAKNPPQPSAGGWQANHKQQRSSGVFKWILASVWVSWFAALAVYFIASMASYDRIGHGGNDVFYYVGTGVFTQSAWMSVNAIRTAFVAMLTLVPLAVISIVSYFFTSGK